MSFMFAVFPILFTLVFILVFGIIIYTFVRAAKQEKKNNQSPKLTVEAKVVTKRTSFRHSSGTNHVGHGHTSYYVTFEVQSGDRMELKMSGTEYGMLVEGDFGDLSFQGTRYLGFQRKVKTYDL